MSEEEANHSSVLQQVVHRGTTRINKLVVHGFKSFAKKTELVFGSGYNCVLGPNGSGKSNILDALCFVLGRSSAKSLRAEKASNLIYNGGKSKDPGKQAEVSIYFDNTTRIFPFDESEVKITRIVRPSGQGIYKLNDKTRTRQEVVDMLSLSRIDPEGYNIILQGDIIRFVEMSPAERRMLIEDVTGIGVYEEKKQKALNELQKVDEKLKEAEIVLAERETNLKDLKKDRDQAIKYKEILERIDKSKGSLLHIQIERKDKERIEQEEKINKQKEKLTEVQEKIAGIKIELTSKKQEIAKINSDIEQRGEKEQLFIHKEVESLKVNVATTKNKIESHKVELEKLKNRKKQLEENAKELDDKIKELEKQKKISKDDEDSLAKAVFEIDKKLLEFRKKNQLDNVGELEKEIEEIDKQTEEKQKDMLIVRQEQQEFLRQKDKLEFQIQAIDEKIEKVLLLEKENKEQLDELKRKREQFKKLALELNEIINQDSSYAAQIGEARRKYAKAQEDLARFNARTASLQESLSGDVAVKKILAQKGKMRGIHGTVSELGEVKSKYALALEVAAGNKLKGVVVDDDKVAAECISYLKENKFGIATFFPLNKIKPKPILTESLPLTTQGVFGLAINLIEFEPKFKNVFSFIFGDTLVVETIDVARKIGIGTVKMTTLEGDIAELSGAMQGGFRQKRAMGLGFKESEIVQGAKECEKIVSETESMIATLETRKNENEEKITRIRELKATIEGEIIKMEKSLHLESGDVDVNKKIKLEINQEIKKIEAHLLEMQNTISSANTEMAQVKIKKQELRDKISNLRNPLIIAELNAFSEKKKEIETKLLELRSDMKNVDVQIQTIILPEKENILKIVKQHEKEDETFRFELKQLQESLSTFEVGLKEKEKKEKEFYEQFKDLFTQKGKLEEEVKKRVEKIEGVLEVSKEIEMKINGLSIERARLQAELEGMQKEFAPFQNIELFKSKTEEELKIDIKESENFMARIGTVNMRALEIYEIVAQEYQELVNKKEKLRFEKEDVLIMMNEIETRKKELFLKTFDVVNEQFKFFFSMLTTKGDATLELENPEAPFEGGVFIKVRISGNKFLDIRSLSGGEKTMTALAFIFAIQEHEPASFYVLDEVDAALDKRNSQKLAEMVRKYAHRAQYVIISHNDGVIGEADNLYGVSMDEHGISTVVSLKV